MNDRSVMIMLADSLPESLILTLLSGAIAEYQEEQNTETTAKLHHCLSLTVLKLITRNQGVERTKAEIEQVGRIRDMFKAVN